MTPLMRPKPIGFTLIELSIVLVIIALLVAGILVGSTMIESAKIRKVGTEYERYMTVVNTFRNRFNCVPGDCSTATRFNLGANGDGDGLIDYPSGGNLEPFTAWQHLSSSGLLDASYSGTASYGCIGSNACIIPGSNAPATLMGGNTATMIFTYDKPNLYMMVGMEGSFTNVWHNPIFTPQMQYAIDLKYDDGQPFVGKLRDTIGSNSWNTPGCTTSETSTAATYVVDASTPLCQVMWDTTF